MHPHIRAYLAQIGEKGGKAKSPKKTRAARKNARKPRKKPTNPNA